MAITDDLADAAVRHQTFLIRFGTSSANRMIALLDEAEKDLVGRIADRVGRLPTTAVDNHTARLQAILGDIRAQSIDLSRAMYFQQRADFVKLAEQEVDIADVRISEAIGADLGNFRPSPETLRTMVEDQAVAGRRLRTWFTRLGAERYSRLTSAVNLGVLEGDTNRQIVNRFREAEDVTRRAARTLVRTHVNHIANAARGKYFEANSDLIEAVQWVSTLDKRTTMICASRDGKTWPVDEGPRPPAHPNCRSIMVPVLVSWEKLNGRAMKPGRGGRKFEEVFERRLRDQGFDADAISRIKAKTRSSMNGQVADSTTYQTWLERQPTAFQNEVLGRTKGRLFREGGLTLDRFVEPTTGRPLTLDEIRRANASAWMRITN